jgi:Tfp pilus assembly ATPase PilU
MQTMEVALNNLVEQGVISYDDAVDRSLHPKEIRRPAPVAETVGR